MAIVYNFAGRSAEWLTAHREFLWNLIQENTAGSITSGTSAGQTFTVNARRLEDLWAEYNAAGEWLGLGPADGGAGMAFARPNFSGRRFY